MWGQQGARIGPGYSGGVEELRTGEKLDGRKTTGDEHLAIRERRRGGLITALVFGSDRGPCAGDGVEQLGMGNGGAGVVMAADDEDFAILQERGGVFLSHVGHGQS